MVSSFLDADNRSKGDHDEEFQLDKSKLTEDNYSAMMHRGTNIYPYPWIVKLCPKGKAKDPPGPKKWKWVNSRHEVIVPDGNWKTETVLLTGGHVISGHAGYRARDPFTYIGDTCAFFRDLKKNPNDTRATFYAAQSLEMLVSLTWRNTCTSVVLLREVGLKNNTCLYFI